MSSDCIRSVDFELQSHTFDGWKCRAELINWRGGTGKTDIQSQDEYNRFRIL